MINNDKPPVYTPPEPPKKSFAKQSGVNYANESPNKIKRQDAEYIDKQLNVIFIKGHAHNVHDKQMDLVRGNAKRNAIRRKMP